ncbi:MAG: MFS transporter, partial [Chloroflexi bacterium]|nr:MFS transporter [Chloroflexota bacterium]
MRLIRDRLFFAVASTHLMVDILNSQLAVLLAYLSGPLGLSNAQIGLVATSYTICSSLLQPVFGWLADRVGARWPGAGGLAWQAGFFGAALLAPGRAAILLLVLASLGSGAFHPAGTMKATQRGHQHFAGQAATAASVFFLFGQAGLSLGPAVGGAVLERLGEHGLLILAVLALPAALNAAFQLRPAGERREGHGAPAATSPRALARGLRGGALFFVAFALLLTARSWAQSNMMTFVPKYLSDLGLDPTAFGAIAALFMAGSAIGGVAGGALGDRWGKRATVFWTLLLAALPLYLFPLAGTSAWVYLLAPLAGAFTGASHSIV